MKSGSLNFLEPSGPLQACNGTDLPYWATISISKGTLFQGDVRCARKVIEVVKMGGVEE